MCTNAGLPNQNAAICHYFVPEYIFALQRNASLFTLTTHDHCHVNKQNILKGWHHEFIPEGLISSYSDVLL